MKKSLFLFGGLLVITMFFSTGCTEKKPEAVDSLQADTMLRDTLENDSLDNFIAEQPMPKAADELFDDFIFNFAANKKVQKERTDFPLSHVTFGKMSSVNMKQWNMEHFFMRQGYYTLIFNSDKQKSLGKNTNVGNVYVEKIDNEKKQVKRWQFNRVEGLWRLQNVCILPLSQHEDADFVSFYNSFATDSVFQMQSIASQVKFSGPDPDDDFSRMEGELMPEQWPMFAPWMPTGSIYNIHYGDQPYKKTNHRLFIIRGVASGLETELTFEKQNGKWLLIKFES